jgi:hypothetical protein
VRESPVYAITPVSGTYVVPSDSPLDAYRDYLRSLPPAEAPEVGDWGGWFALKQDVGVWAVSGLVMGPCLLKLAVWGMFSFIWAVQCWKNDGRKSRAWNACGRGQWAGCGYVLRDGRALLAWEAEVILQ